MTVTLELPDDIALALSASGDLPKRALEVLAIDGYRRELLTQLQVGKLLGLNRIETEDFLARHTDLYSYEPEDLRREVLDLEAYTRRIRS